ncbi:MAG: hypothetical protein PUP91_27805 [Rhizonema sp. PD37]|nr:hypothetical protein [Rhizonema sp. PD37]
MIEHHCHMVVPLTYHPKPDFSRVELFYTDQLQAIAVFLQFMNNFYPSTA